MLSINLAALMFSLPVSRGVKPKASHLEPRSGLWPRADYLCAYPTRLPPWKLLVPSYAAKESRRALYYTVRQSCDQVDSFPLINSCEKCLALI